MDTGVYHSLKVYRQNLKNNICHVMVILETYFLDQKVALQTRVIQLLCLFLAPFNCSTFSNERNDLFSTLFKIKMEKGLL